MDLRTIETPAASRELTTYSSWATFRDCRMKFWWRYVEGIVPTVTDPALSFGSLIHEALRLWHQTRDLNMVREEIRLQTLKEEDRVHRLKALAMLEGYAATYPEEAFEVVALERKFKGEIRNPETNCASRSFILAGKVDGVVRQGGRYYLLEHKTASQIDGGYLEKLWCDFQISLYSRYLEGEGFLVEGVVYNVLQKPALRRYEVNSKRNEPESDEAYLERLRVKCLEPGMYHRETITLSAAHLEMIQGELWDLCQSLLEAKRRGSWYQNPSQCWKWNRPCPYWRLCRAEPLSRDPIKQNFYTSVPPHEELREDEPEQPF